MLALGKVLEGDVWSRARSEKRGQTARPPALVCQLRRLLSLNASAPRLRQCRVGEKAPLPIVSLSPYLDGREECGQS
jgi:hypothetical protein